MLVKNITKCCFKTVSLIFMLLSTTVYAENKQILCPSYDLIKNKSHHVDTVQLMDEGKLFLVYSNMDSIFDEQGKLWWQIATISNTTDFNTAYTTGQNNVRNIAKYQDKYAKVVNDVYNCRYTDNAGTGTVIAQADAHDQNRRLMNLIKQLPN